MPRAGPRRITKYTRDFKFAAVRLSHQAELQVQEVAAARGIHPFMWSRLADDAPRRHPARALAEGRTDGPARELVLLQVLERKTRSSRRTSSACNHRPP